MRLTIVGVALSFFCPAAVLADACTYTEAQIALQQGNTKRAMTLMQMAANDGDRRALEYLKNRATDLTQPVVVMAEFQKKSIF